MATEPISILYFSNSTARGGAEEHVLTLLREVDRKLFQPGLVCPAVCVEKLGADIPNDVRVFPLTLQKPYEWNALALRRILHQEKVGILHSHHFGASLAASPVGWASGVPVMIETPHIREAWRRGLIKRHFIVDRVVGRCVDRYIAVSEANARYLVNEKGLPARKVEVIQNGCDLKKFDIGRAPVRGIRESLGFGEDDPILLALGRLEVQKGHRFLLEAHARVLREFPNARLICVGEGVLRAKLEEMARQLGIHEHVRFVGFQSNVADWLALADISVLPSLFEGLPLVAIESLAAGRAMVATDVDGTAEVVVNEKTGLTVSPENVPELVNAILRLLRQPDLRRQLAQAGRQWVVEHFSQEQQIRKTQELYLRAWNLKCAAANRIDIGEASEEHDRRDTQGALRVEEPVDVSESR
jgi:glycosyltransferase involved in cell wall biosynthesis